MSLRARSVCWLVVYGVYGACGPSACLTFDLDDSEKRHTPLLQSPWPMDEPLSQGPMSHISSQEMAKGRRESARKMARRLARRDIPRSGLVDGLVLDALHEGFPASLDLLNWDCQPQLFRRQTPLTPVAQVL
jgi:hypothetical protein